MLKYLVVLLLFISGSAYADPYASFLLGVFNSTGAKFLQVGYRGPIGLGFDYQTELGLWVDPQGNGRVSSGYIATQIGLQAGDLVKVHVFVGPCLITSPDLYLGGVFQFTEDFFIGLSGKNSNTIGVKYKHFSSAGIEMPNLGRDFVGIEVSIPF